MSKSIEELKELLTWDLGEDIEKKIKEELKRKIIEDMELDDD